MEKKILFSIAAEDTQIAIFSNGTLEYVEHNDAETKTSEHLLEEKTVAELKDIIEQVANLAMDLPSIIQVYSGCGFSSVQILKKTYNAEVDEENYGTQCGLLQDCVLAIFSVLEKYEWISFSHGYLCVLDKKDDISKQLASLGETIKNSAQKNVYGIHGALIKYLIQSNETVYFISNKNDKEKLKHKFLLRNDILKEETQQYQSAPFNEVLKAIAKSGATIGYYFIDDCFSTDFICDVFLTTINIKELFSKWVGEN